MALNREGFEALALVASGLATAAAIAARGDDDESRRARERVRYRLGEMRELLAREGGDVG